MFNTTICHVCYKGTMHYDRGESTKEADVYTCTHCGVSVPVLDLNQFDDVPQPSVGRNVQLDWGSVYEFDESGRASLPQELQDLLDSLED